MELPAAPTKRNQYTQCITADCGNNAHYNKRGLKAMFCSLHKTTDMANVNQPLCELLTCVKSARYGTKGGSRTRCSEHQLPEMINLTNKLCEVTGCNAIANYGDANTRVKKYCAAHNVDGMVRIRGNKCLECTANATHNYSNALGTLYCCEHCKEGMIYKYLVYCKETGCTTLASYGYPNSTKEACQTHIKPGMVNLHGGLCDFPECKIRASYNVQGQPARRCLAHKTEEMIYTYAHLCTECSIVASYGFKSDLISRRCREHASPDMVRVSYVCIKEGCYNTATHGKNDQRSYCSEHAPVGYERVVHPSKLCKTPGCTTSATCGPLFGVCMHCSKHKNNNEYSMTKIHPKCTCIDCPRRPHYTNDGTNYPLRCELHQWPNDTNVVERPCLNCGLPDYINAAHGFCNTCADYTFKRLDKVKENRIKILLETYGIPCELHDKTVTGGCSRKRPDFVIPNIKGTFKIILEVDEHQHETYPLECEVGRMRMLYQDYAGYNIIFIRFNPDSYITGGITNTEYKSRETRLIQFITALRNVENTSSRIIVTYMYYDNYDGNQHYYNIDYDTGAPSHNLTPFM